jgi:hypothetical protein
MTDLSPAALATWNAFLTHSEWEVTTAELKALAAALRVAADQVVPHEYLTGVDAAVEARQLTRLRLLAIAAELEAQ